MHAHGHRDVYYFYYYCFTTPENEYYDYKIELLKYNGLDDQVPLAQANYLLTYVLTIM